MGPIEAKMKLHWGSEDENHTCSRPPFGIGYNNGEVIHQHKGGLWWFWDELWTDEFGGYCLREQAEEAAKRYGEQL